MTGMETLDLTEALACRYKPLELIGSGGIGVVYKVYDISLNNEPVALKLLNRNLLPDPSYAARFRREVSVARRLAHPNIVKIFDFSELRAGGYFFTMELVEGSDLRAVITREGSKLPLRRALDIIFQAALALDYAHRIGIVHRDIKAENILIAADSESIKLSDFSSAKEIAMDLGITPEGGVLGTPQYMAPELLRGAKAQAAADIYSLGILFFEVLCGVAPFNGEGLAAIFAQHMSEPIPRLATYRNEAPEWCQEMVETCCEKDPSDRYTSVSEFLSELLDFAISDGFELTATCLPPSVHHLLATTKRRQRGLFSEFLPKSFRR